MSELKIRPFPVKSRDKALPRRIPLLHKSIPNPQFQRIVYYSIVFPPCHFTANGLILRHLLQPLERCILIQQAQIHSVAVGPKHIPDHIPGILLVPLRTTSALKSILRRCGTPSAPRRTLSREARIVSTAEASPAAAALRTLASCANRMPPKTSATDMIDITRRTCRDLYFESYLTQLSYWNSPSRNSGSI